MGRVLFDKKKELESEVFALNAKGLSNPNSYTVPQSNENVNLEQKVYVSMKGELDSVSEEYTTDTININGKERPVYNSEGDRIAKSEKALRAFYKWFGDSKVVDDGSFYATNYRQQNNRLIKQ